MKCCRICLATNELSNIFETEDIVPNIIAIAGVDISQNDGLPQHICLLCKHELDIAINFKNKCETIFEMLRAQHNKKLEVKDNIILNLLSGGKALDETLPIQAKESILNTVKNSIRNNVKRNIIASEEHAYKKYKLGKKNLNSEKTNAHYKMSREECFEEGHNFDQTEGINQEEITTKSEFEDQMIDADNHTTDADDQMTDITETEYEIIPESLSIKNRDLMCRKCYLCFTNEESLFNHMQRIHSKTVGQCQICLVYFPNDELLKEHLSSKHEVSDNNENILNGCKSCKKTLGHQAESNSHLCLTNDREEYWCDICQLNSKNVTDFENHMKNVHQRGDFTCDQCHDECYPIDLYKHLKEHSENRNRNQIELLCSECNKSFVSNEEWNTHIKSCQPSQQENINRKAVKNLKDLLDKNERSFVCPLCEKCFKTSSMLEIHVRMHTGEKAFKCLRCHVAFDKLSHLTEHRRIHNGTKPHVCSICQMTFHKSHCLERHLLLHGNLIQFTKEETFLSYEVDNED